MARKGNSYDNAKAESCIKTLKCEEVSSMSTALYKRHGRELTLFIREAYNEDRLHSSLVYLPPSEFEEKFLAAGSA